MKEKEKITQENLTTNFIKNLNQAMEEKNYTQTRLADETGINRSQLNKILSGKAVPTTKTIVALCDTLEIDLGYLYGAYNEKNLDFHIISELTGLSEKAAEKLISWKNGDGSEIYDSAMWIQYISEMIENPKSDEYMSKLHKSIADEIHNTQLVSGGNSYYSEYQMNELESKHDGNVYALSRISSDIADDIINSEVVKLKADT